jgi:hypothetical protein
MSADKCGADLVEEIIRVINLIRDDPRYPRARVGETEWLDKHRFCFLRVFRVVRVLYQLPTYITKRSVKVSIGTRKARTTRIIIDERFQFILPANSANERG